MLDTHTPKAKPLSTYQALPDPPLTDIKQKRDANHIAMTQLTHPPNDDIQVLVNESPRYDWHLPTTPMDSVRPDTPQYQMSHNFHYAPEKHYKLEASITPIGYQSSGGPAKDLNDIDEDHERTGGNVVAPFLISTPQKVNRGQRQPFMKKLLSHQMPLNLGTSHSALIGANVSRLDENERVSVLHRHKEARSQFEQTTILEIYENRAGVSPNRWFGYVLLAMVIASGAAFVPLGVSLDVSNPMLKVSWRVSTMLPFISLLGLWQAFSTPNFDPKKALLNPKTLQNLIIAAMAISLQQYCAIFAGKYTLMSHSVIMVNLSGPVIVGWRLLKRQAVHTLEISGCGIAVFGSIISIMDHTSEKVNTEDQNILLGDSVALIGSFLCALWMLKNEELVQHLPPLYAMTFISLFSNIILIILGISFYGDVFTLDANPKTGVFGYLGGGPQLGVYVILVYGLFTGACNMGAYSMSCKYFSPLVIGTAVLFEPIGSQIIGCLLGLDRIPGFLTWLGTALTLGGLYFVGRGGQRLARTTHHI
ncbi:hypothetical protein FGO68_gene16966 [Halteria grandinella]|uniref:EamA domain-containing protein n=1 Tax=Halteria grandinella TaxID=5974 RepID=A0A8J8T3G5_HALGN|nr:hypothetical protein FGO68_gene16966 [Halteria grandinella]